MANKSSEGASGHPVRMPFCRYNAESRTLAIEKRQLASEKQLRALLQETERLREENVCYAFKPQRQVLLVVSVQEASGKLKPEPESIYPGSTGAVPGAYNARPHEPRTPCLELPTRPTRAWRSGHSSHNRAPRPDPMIAPWCRTYLRIVTLGHPSDAERSLTPSGTTSWEKPPKRATIGSISKRLDDMLSTPFALISPLRAPKGIPRTKVFHIRWDNIPSITSCTIDSS
ncbi:hypothetical protein CK203_111026 [Vitis vinifera]|uniref:Uncharacterized protein n=1 Tax=Vitis vinifera TaxID=29760 RepID=A0A438CQS8_VITVI|nr:hypothetical protein CK203_111026 [Vitis vinifera]